MLNNQKSRDCSIIAKHGPAWPAEFSYDLLQPGYVPISRGCLILIGLLNSVRIPAVNRL